jgi:hypothetical protein
MSQMRCTAGTVLVIVDRGVLNIAALPASISVLNEI